MNQNRYKFIISTVKKAGERLLSISQKKLIVASKNNDVRDIVTSADLEINKFITNSIKEVFPGEIIYSEEDSNVDISSGSYWAIDPIDGTSCFARSFPHFAVVISFVENGVPVSGAIYNPKTSELFSFEKSKGAFLNERKVKVSAVQDLSRSYAILRIGRDEKYWKWGLASLGYLLKNGYKTFNLGSSALDICFVGAGRVELCIYGTLTTIDIAGAIGFVKEAGGFVVDRSGKELKILTKDKQTIVAVNNKNILSSLRNDIILPKD